MYGLGFVPVLPRIEHNPLCEVDIQFLSFSVNMFKYFSQVNEGVGQLATVEIPSMRFGAGHIVV